MTKPVTLHFRSKDRVRNYGEVFTSENFISQMLGKLNEEQFSDESSIFFEPTCGHGNIVELILKKRLESLYNKAISRKLSNPHLYAIANAINTLWAIDLDSRNIELCRARVVSCCVNFLKQKIKNFEIDYFISRNKEFIAHM